MLHIQIALADDLSDVMMVGKRIIAYTPEFLICLTSLAQSSVIASHIAEQANVVVVGIDIGFEVGLSGEIVDIDFAKLLVERQGCALLTHHIVANRAIEDGLRQR